jgi:hypothetical protein
VYSPDNHSLRWTSEGAHTHTIHFGAISRLQLEKTADGFSIRTQVGVVCMSLCCLESECDAPYVVCERGGLCAVCVCYVSVILLSLTYSLLRTYTITHTRTHTQANSTYAFTNARSPYVALGWVKALHFLISRQQKGAQLSAFQAKLKQATVAASPGGMCM